MNQDFQIALSPAPNGIAMTARSRLSPQAGQKLSARQAPALNLALIDELRQGDPHVASVLTITNDVSNWLLGADLQPYLSAALLGLNKDKLRLIFNVDGDLRKDAALGEAIADLPVEMLQLPGDNVPLVLSPQVAAFVHLLDKVPYALATSTQRNPPLRVLIVHSNPADLGGYVPDPMPIRQHILRFGQHFGIKMVEVDMLSRTPGDGVVGLPTNNGLWKQLKKPLPYDILVYLGHGNRAQYRPDLLPVGLLYLESDDGQNSREVTADVLATELHNHPIPVVLLIGCLTAADVLAAGRNDLLASMPGAMRGNQGVAQALVDSASGVQLAVGMRCRLESDDAQTFLLAVFKSLLHDRPGNVEAAIHAGREELKALSGRLASWSAPLIFSTLRDEPMFDFLASPPPIIIGDRDQAFRKTFWDYLSGMSLGKSEPAEVDSRKEMIELIEARVVQDVVAQAPLLMAKWQCGERDRSVVVPIHLYGQLNVDQLDGKLTVDGDGLSIVKADATPGLAADSWFLSAVKGQHVEFQIKRKNPGGNPLPEGPIIDLTLKLGSTGGVEYPVTVSGLISQPKRAICPGNSVVIVPLP